MKLNWKTYLKIGIGIFLLYLCIYYWPSVAGLLAAVIGAAAPLIIGCVIAYPVNILMTAYEKLFFSKTKKEFLIKCRRPVSLIAAYLTLVMIVTLRSPGARS